MKVSAWASRAGRTSWLLSGLLFLLFPKCPFCLAGWLLIGGFAVSASLAWWLYGSLIAVAVISWLGMGWWLFGHRRGLLEHVAKRAGFRIQCLSRKSSNSTSLPVQESNHDHCCCSSPRCEP